MNEESVGGGSNYNRIQQLLGQACIIYVVTKWSFMNTKMRIYVLIEIRNIEPIL